MLILTRRVGETIRINDNVSVTVLGVQGMQTRIGVKAPVNVEVHREEIYQRVQAERIATVANRQHIDRRIKQSADSVDPRNLFIRINPTGADRDELEKGRRGFVDARVHAQYLIFLSGYQAAQEVEPCEA